MKIWAREKKIEENSLARKMQLLQGHVSKKLYNVATWILIKSNGLINL
jgi:hypothetical protein